MPDFFLIAGLFLARMIDRDWRHYLDKKVVHFAYFYVLWLIINFAFKGVSFAADEGWNGVAQQFLLSFIEPFSTLWFIYLLAIFFVVTKLTRRLPQWSVLLVGIALHVAPISTGWTVIDEFASRFVFFYAGYIFAPQIFRYAAFAGERPLLAIVGVAVWAVVNELLVLAGVAASPVVSLPLGFVGAGAIVDHWRPLLAPQDHRTDPLYRRQFDRRLSRLLHPDGGDTRGTGPSRHHLQCRRRVPDRVDHGRRFARSSSTGSSATAGPVSCSGVRPGPTSTIGRPGSPPPSDGKKALKAALRRKAVPVYSGMSHQPCS